MQSNWIRSNFTLWIYTFYRYNDSNCQIKYAKPQNAQKTIKSLVTLPPFLPSFPSFLLSQHSAGEPPLSPPCRGLHLLSSGRDAEHRRGAASLCPRCLPQAGGRGAGARWGERCSAGEQTPGCRTEPPLFPRK